MSSTTLRCKSLGPKPKARSRNKGRRGTLRTTSSQKVSTEHSSAAMLCECSKLHDIGLHRAQKKARPHQIPEHPPLAQPAEAGASATTCCDRHTTQRSARKNKRIHDRARATQHSDNSTQLASSPARTQNHMLVDHANMYLLVHSRIWVACSPAGPEEHKAAHPNPNP